ncbi:MAG: ribonuclease P protein component [Firmicutes bacterium]|nr:ribonuclease P protein component [Bacillota bacterium]
MKKNWEFQEAFKKGHSYYNSFLVLYVYPLPEEKNQLKVAFCAGKKLGSAVRRNRIKRQMKHAFLALQDQVKKGFSLIIIARGRAEELDYESISHSLRDLLGKAGLLRVRC